LVGDFERYKAQGESGDLAENRVEITVFGEVCKVKRGKIWEPLKETRERREFCIADSERESDVVGDGKEVFGD
jgi:hypothetical protein